MAFFKVEIFKQFIEGDRQAVWTNVYDVTAASLGDASDAAGPIISAEQPLYYDNITIVRAVTRHAGTGTPGFIATPTNTVGSRGSAPNELVPSWNCGRVDFTTDDDTRPARKYIRNILTEGDFEGEVLEAGIVGLLQTYGDEIITVDGVTTPGGGTLSAAVVIPFVQMRQTSWSRRARPGFHRGYIAN